MKKMRWSRSSESEESPFLALPKSLLALFALSILASSLPPSMASTTKSHLETPSEFFANASSSLINHHGEVGLSQQRSKRQYGSSGFQCPPGCFPCSPMQCQTYQTQCMPQQPRVLNMMSCCCIPLVPAKPDLKNACDGEEAVAACINNLCGQGYFCTKKKYCCRCQSGKSLGECVNGLCPAGYQCNTENNFCCAIWPCVNGKCPEGYDCNTADNMCYAKASAQSMTSSGSSSDSSTNAIMRNLVDQTKPLGSCTTSDDCPGMQVCVDLRCFEGPCINGVCGPGFTCDESRGSDGVCVPVTRSRNVYIRRGPSRNGYVRWLNGANKAKRRTGKKSKRRGTSWGGPRLSDDQWGAEEAQLDFDENYA